jgi:DNA-binding NtrC family response regulator
MKTEQSNLFIIDDNQLMVADLRNYLTDVFGEIFTIHTFSTGESALKMVDKNTSVVILDYFLKNELGNEVLKSIKKINPKTEVIMLSSNDDVKVAIDAFRNGATDYVIKGDKAGKKITHIIYHIAAFPVRLVVKEFKVTKYIALYILTFLTVGVLAFIGFSLFYLR